MPINSSVKLLRIWPLMFSALAICGLVYIFPNLYENVRYFRDGVQTVGWYSNFDADDTDGHSYFKFAYKVGGVTYGGRGLYDDATSDIYFRNPGDPVSLTYLNKEPWVSTAKPWKWNLRQETLWATLCFVSLLASVCFSLFHLCTKRPKVANWLGILSIFLSVVPILYSFHSEIFPQHALIETVVLIGGVGGSLLAALSAGLLGSRWWFVASLAAMTDAVLLGWGFIA
jgi:hypothetical protein